MTNRERLAKMTDEELADWVCYTIDMPCCICPGKDMCEHTMNEKIGLVEWLKAEVEEEE